VKKKVWGILVLSCAVLMAGCGNREMVENTTAAAQSTTAVVSEAANEAADKIESAAAGDAATADEEDTAASEELTEATTEEIIEPVEATLENALDVSVKYFGVELLSEDEMFDLVKQNEGIPDEKIGVSTPAILDYLEENDRIASREILERDAHFTHEVKEGTTIYLSIYNSFYEYVSAEIEEQQRHKNEEYFTEEAGYKIICNTEEYFVFTFGDTIIMYNGRFGDDMFFSGQIYYAPPTEGTSEWDIYNEGMKQYDRFFNSLGVENPVRVVEAAK